MPGLCLTLAQASRLFGLQPDTCALLLEALVREGFLARRDDRYALSGTGRHAA